MVGEFLEVRIHGDEIADVMRLDRDHVRDGDTVWIMDDGELRIQKVDIAVRDAEHAFITGGLDDDDRVVTSNLATVTEGARLRVDTGRDDTGRDGAGRSDAGRGDVEEAAGE